MKLKKSILIIFTFALIFFTVINTSVYAETTNPEEEQPATEEVETPEEEQPATDPTRTEGVDPAVTEDNEGDPVKVDPNNTDPILFDSSSNQQKEIIKTPIDTPASVTGEKYQGSATVTDFTTSGSKAFYTIRSADNKTYFIIIDMDKTENNVYFLSEINGEELTIDKLATTVSPQKEKVVKKEEVVTPKEEATNKPKGNRLLLPIIGVGSVLFIGFHFFFGKLKSLNPLLKKKAKEGDPVEEDLEEDIYNEEYLVDDEYEED